MTDARRQRQIARYRESEARWLQRMTFASGKARVAREKLSEVVEEDLNPVIVLDDGTSLPLDTLEEIIAKRVEFLMQALGRRFPGA